MWHRTDALDDSRLPEPPSTPTDIRIIICANKTNLSMELFRLKSLMILGDNFTIIPMFLFYVHFAMRYDAKSLHARGVRLHHHHHA